MGLRLDLQVERLALAQPFHIAGHVFTETPVVVATLDDGTHRGRGEAAGVYYLDDTVDRMTAAIESVRGAVEAGITREALQPLLPPGGARNALDCALWELEARQAGRPVWELAGLDAPRPLLTTFTIGAGTPEAMAAAARVDARAIKLKLTGERALDIARVEAVRAARPDVWLGVDANQGYAIDDLPRLIPALVEAEVALLEQPLARGREADLQGFVSPIPIAADESALSLADVPGLAGRFQTVNIKLDKCGGLTEGLAMARLARSLGLGVMVGNMVGSSLAMAPAFLLGQLCDVVDLDGPTFLAADRQPGVRYQDGMVFADEAIWGRDLASSSACNIS
jgi:L-Ala-D/L-Glu epimerase